MLSMAVILAAWAATSRPGEAPVALVFSIDQGFGNGVVVNRDLAAVRRIAEALRTLRPRYDVFALLEPQVADKARLDAVLDVLVAADVPFFFDAISSDAMTLGTSTPQNAPADGPHGVAISIAELERYKRRYGHHLAGLRFTEVFSQDFTIRAVRTTNPEWKTADWKLPPDEFFQAAPARAFLKFARTHRMLVQWSDWHWHAFASWDAPQKDREATLRGLLGEFPGLVTVTYANNEPQEASVARLKTWPEAVEPFVAAGAQGIGVSNQSWLRKDETRCPIEDILAWTRSALERKSRLIQFEPAWYFFELPRGSFRLEDYTKDPRWRKAGTPTPAFEALARELQRPAPGSASTRAAHVR